MGIFGANRQSVRLKEFDYTSGGMYYVTLCTEKRQCLLGDIHKGVMIRSPVGEMVQTAWLELLRYDPRISLDEFVIMPNHLHGIIVLEWGDPLGGQARGPAPTEDRLSLPDVIQRFKSWTTRQYFDMTGPKAGRLWQRNYYEHIIRNESDLNRIRTYIRHNPAQWENDPENRSLLRLMT